MQAALALLQAGVPSAQASKKRPIGAEAPGGPPPPKKQRRRKAGKALLPLHPLPDPRAAVVALVTSAVNAVGVTAPGVALNHKLARPLQLDATRTSYDPAKAAKRATLKRGFGHRLKRPPRVRECSWEGTQGVRAAWEAYHGSVAASGVTAATMDLNGAPVRVVACEAAPSLVGCEGMVLMESNQNFSILRPPGDVVVLPKRGSQLCVPFAGGSATLLCGSRLGFVST